MGVREAARGLCFLYDTWLVLPPCGKLYQACVRCNM